MDGQLWAIAPGQVTNQKFITWARDREDAKRKARRYFGSLLNLTNPDGYICSPITNPGDKVKIDIDIG